ncbi:ras GEF [Fomitiporia mediterranea MF3/22]|uniref:ras GEF n=1 Tax=Fomitiporia mediterranea (strain MF3/22) TaxID=694068 RepID=UPI000440871E|nr:ras GEF [Fomitiporia mediterranea MF3/22]EJC97805.1 ras GEF [Fomitiporia mediterranea MF3/22]
MPDASKARSCPPSIQRTEHGCPNISRPRPLIKRSKSMATSIRSSSASGASRPSSTASTMSKSSNYGMTMMQTIIKALNTPISDINFLSDNRSSTSDRSSIFSRFRRGDDKQTVDNGQCLPVPHLRPASHLRQTTMSLLSDYSTFRSSIMSVGSTGMASDEIVAAAKRYYSSMKQYLTLFDTLPPSVRDTLDVQRMRTQLEFTVDLLQPVMQESLDDQTVLILDNTLMLVKNILVDVHNLLVQQAHPARVVLEEDEHEEDRSSGEWSGQCEYEYEHDIPGIRISIHVDEPDEDKPEREEPNPGPSGLRRMRSSMAILGSISKDKNASNDARGSTTNLTESDGSSDDQSHTLRGTFTEHSSSTQETLVDLSQSIEAVSASLVAFKSVPLFSSGNQSDASLPRPVKPADTMDVTYNNDGSPIAMSSAAIIEQLIKELGARPDKAAVVHVGGFSDVILSTFRFFWEPMQLLGYLEEVYDESYYNDRKLSVVLIVRTWVLFYWLPEDSTAEGVLKSMQRFLGRALADGLVCVTIIADILNRLRQYSSNNRLSAVTRDVYQLDFEDMPRRLIDFRRDDSLYKGQFENIRLTGFNNKDDCVEFARQLTLRESALYLQLSAREVISCFVPGEKEKNGIAKEKLDRLREFSCTVKRWAEWNVLRRTTPLKRARTIAFMMRLAKECVIIRNFSAAHSILYGVLSVHLDILFQTEAELSPKARRAMTYVSDFFKNNRNICMESSAQPTVPIMAVYSGKLSRLSEFAGVTSKSKVDDSVELINISFFRTATRITYAMESNQHPYKFKAYAPLQAFINYMLDAVPGEDDIHELYLKVKHEEQNGLVPTKPSLFNRLRNNSIASFPRF